MTTATLNGGLAQIVALLVAATYQWIGWGTGTTPVTAADTGLETPASEARVSGTKSSQTTTVANDTYRVVGTLTCAGAGKTISEVGLFSAVTAGVCFLRSQFTGVALSVGESIEFTIDTQFTTSVITT